MTDRSDDRLGDRTAMGAVTLHVDDLAGMREYYTRALGLDVLDEGAGRVTLGRAGAHAVVLRHTPGLPVPSRTQAGLFHTALLLPTPADLAATVRTALGHPRSRFVGSADHLVSEAFYLTDPEGNGIELYRDRPRDRWHGPDGRLRMDTLHLDPRAYLEEHLTETAADGLLDAPLGVGHVHLQVGDVEAARPFYLRALGLQETATVPGALFVSAGGYHHHVAVNSWRSRGAGPRASSLGLGRMTVHVAAREELDALVVRLRGGGFRVEDDGATVRTEDPWRNEVAVTLAA